MSSATTENVRVTVDSEYLPDQSTPGAQRYAFAYHVRIQNLGGDTVQLQSRHWLILDGNGDEQEVRGEGVVGEKPRLAPGEGFEYTSGCILRTPHGAMRGSYQMVRDDGRKFDAEIASFSLAVPGSLN